MKNWMFFIALIFTMTITSGFAQMTIPRVVVQEVYDYQGSYPDNVIYPEEGSIKFRAWIASRPEYVLTDEHDTCHADMQGGYFTVRFNLGNFPGLAGAPVDWQHGEIVRIEVTHTATGRIATAEFPIEMGSSPIIRRHEDAISLRNPRKEEVKPIPEELEELEKN